MHRNTPSILMNSTRRAILRRRTHAPWPAHLPLWHYSARSPGFRTNPRPRLPPARHAGRARNVAPVTAVTISHAPQIAAGLLKLDLAAITDHDVIAASSHGAR